MQGAQLSHTVILQRACTAYFSLRQPNLVMQALGEDQGCIVY